MLQGSVVFPVHAQDKVEVAKVLALDLSGLSLSDADLATLLDVDVDVWTEEASRIPAFFETFEGRMPKALWDQQKALDQRLSSARSASMAAE